VDRREQILKRLLVILQSLTMFGTVGTTGPPVRLVARNYKLSDYSNTPALLLMDGTETVPDPAPVRARPDAIPPGVAQSIARMYPQMFVVLDDRTPANLNSGEDINAWRAALIILLGNDTVLRGLVTGSGKVDYLGTETDYQTGSTMDGRGQLNIAIDYPVSMDELASATTRR